MNELLLHLLSIAYGATGIIATIGYIPTMKDLYIHKKKSANINSYIIWTICSLIVVLYSIFILPDFLFITVSILNFVSCFIIFILSIRLKFFN